MCFVTGSDEKDSIDIVLFPTIYKNYSNIKTGRVAHITGKVEKRFDKYQLVVNKLLILNEEG